MGDNWGDEQTVGVEVRAPEVADVKLFGKWPLDNIEVNDMSVQVGISYVLISIFYESPFLGLLHHQGSRCSLPSPLCWSLAGQAFQKGSLSHCGTPCLFLDDARS